ARAPHAVSNLDNRHVDIVCAALAHVNVSVLYQFIDTASPPWPTSIALRQHSPSVGQRVARSLPERLPAGPAAGAACAFKAINSRTGEGAAWSLPLSKREREWTPSRGRDQ